jgi:hypothetical protein
MSMTIFTLVAAASQAFAGKHCNRVVLASLLTDSAIDTVLVISVSFAVDYCEHGIRAGDLTGITTGTFF